MANPLILTMPSVRVTIAPAISLALVSWKLRNTPKAAGATVLLKKIAAPSHKPSRSNRKLFIRWHRLQSVLLRRQSAGWKSLPRDKNVLSERTDSLIRGDDTC